MRVIKQAAALSATALLLTHAQAAPTPATPPALIDKIHTVWKTTVKDSNGKLIGQRSTVYDSSDVSSGLSVNDATPWTGEAVPEGWDWKQFVIGRCGRYIDAGDRVRCWRCFRANLRTLKVEAVGNTKTWIESQCGAIVVR